jgi:hypothetical protein
MSVLLVIPLVWLFVSVLVLAICRAAARGDAALAQDLAAERRRAELTGVVELERLFSLDAYDLRPEPAKAEGPLTVGASRRT